MKPIEGDAWRDFVLEAPRPAICAVLLADGRPHATPVWVDVDGDELLFTTWHESLKAHALARDPRVSLCVQDDRPPFAFVTIRGTARVIDDVEAVRSWSARIGGRYMGEDRAEEFGRRNGVPGELLVRVRVEKISGATEMAGSPATP